MEFIVSLTTVYYHLTICHFGTNIYSGYGKYSDVNVNVNFIYIAPLIPTEVVQCAAHTEIDIIREYKTI